jgi:hypothetical protein
VSPHRVVNGGQDTRALTSAHHSYTRWGQRQAESNQISKARKYTFRSKELKQRQLLSYKCALFSPDQRTHPDFGALATTSQAKHVKLRPRRVRGELLHKHAFPRDHWARLGRGGKEEEHKSIATTLGCLFAFATPQPAVQQGPDERKERKKSLHASSSILIANLLSFARSE